MTEIQAQVFFDQAEADQVELDALKARIRRHAVRQHRHGNITTTWANSFLRVLGIAPLEATNSYVIVFPIASTVQVRVEAADRAGALNEAAQYMADRAQQFRIGSRVS